MEQDQFALFGGGRLLALGLDATDESSLGSDDASVYSADGNWDNALSDDELAEEHSDPRDHHSMSSASVQYDSDSDAVVYDLSDDEQVNESNDAEEDTRDKASGKPAKRASNSSRYGKVASNIMRRLSRSEEHTSELQSLE